MKHLEEHTVHNKGSINLVGIIITIIVDDDIVDIDIVIIVKIIRYLAGHGALLTASPLQIKPVNQKIIKLFLPLSRTLYILVALSGLFLLTLTPNKYAVRARVKFNVVLQFYRGKHFKVIHEKKRKISKTTYMSQ